MRRVLLVCAFFVLPVFHLCGLYLMQCIGVEDVFKYMWFMSGISSIILYFVAVTEGWLSNLAFEYMLIFLLGIIGILTAHLIPLLLLTWFSYGLLFKVIVAISCIIQNLSFYMVYNSLVEAYVGCTSSVEAD